MSVHNFTETSIKPKGNLPNQGTLQQHYPFSLPDEKIKKILDFDFIGKRQALPTDALRVSYMLNHIPGHELDHRETGSKAGEDGSLCNPILAMHGKSHVASLLIFTVLFLGFVYYDQARKLKLYLNDRYGYAETASSITSFKGKPGILFVEYDGSNNGVIGLWDGSKVWEADDFTTAGSSLSLWPTGNGNHSRNSGYIVHLL